MRKLHHIASFGERFIGFALAYALLFCETVIQTPSYLFISVVLLASLIGTLLHPDPFFWQKMTLETHIQTLPNIAQVLRATQYYGDPILAERIYQHVSFIDQKNILYAAAFPHEKLEKLRAFWGNIAQEQPTSREAIAALSLIEYSSKQEEQSVTHLQQWKRIEPNDERLERVEK